MLHGNDKRKKTKQEADGADDFKHPLKKRALIGNVAEFVFEQSFFSLILVLNSATT